MIKQQKTGIRNNGLMCYLSNINSCKNTIIITLDIIIKLPYCH